LRKQYTAMGFDIAYEDESFMISAQKKN